MSDASKINPRDNSSPGLIRALGTWMAVAIVVGNVIGSGIFAKPGRIASEAGRFDLIMAAWVLGGVLCLLGALCFAELAVMHPRAGGLYVYLREAYGKRLAFLFGWQEFLFNRPASCGALGMFAVAQFSLVTGQTYSVAVQVSIAILLLVVMAAINVFGVIWGGRMQAATTIVKAGFVAFVAAIPFVLELSGGDVASTARFLEAIEPSKTGLASQFAAALLAVMWAYNGWHGIAPVAEVVREPQRNIPLALFVGIGILIVLYLGANLAYHAVIPMSDMAEPDNQTRVASLMMTRLLGGTGGKLVSIGIMISAIGAINSNMLLGPRVAFAMGRDRVFFPSLGDVHAEYRTPVVSIITQAALGIALIVLSAILVSTVDYFRTQDKSVFDLLTDCIIFVSSIFYALAVASLIVLRRRHPNQDRGYRTPGYPIVPLLYIAVYGWFLVYVFLGQWFEGLIGVGLIAAGLPVFEYFRRKAGAEHGPA